uniref:SHSP domain-containing protein n=1 Tax=Solanum lycopersicum TaxID=4081 RepID=A0A3Q7GBA7_SOLLC
PALPGQHSTSENAKIGTQNHPETGAKTPIPAENGNGDTMKQTDPKAAVEDHKNAATETATIGQPETQGNTALDDQNNATEDQTAFMRELENFYRERAMEFKPPKFYGIPLNCLKLWRSVIRLGGYDRVGLCLLNLGVWLGYWRVGEERGMISQAGVGDIVVYEGAQEDWDGLGVRNLVVTNSEDTRRKCSLGSSVEEESSRSREGEIALLEYERHKMQSGKLQLPIAALPEAGVDNEGNGNQTPGSGRARRDAAARAMQGWHEQRLLGCGEVGEPIVKDKNAKHTPKREKNFKSIGSIKHKRPNEMEHPSKVARTETSKQLVTTVVDLGPPADWVKINVRETKDCFEIYALVPGLLREEVRVQSDPAGRLVITGQPEQLDNPWGITAFKKVVSLPARIDPLQTSAVVTLHGQLFVRVPFA